MTLRKHRPGFTLIEMMAVITIIIILASLVVAGVGFVNDRRAKEKAKIDIALLSKALEEYKLDNGAYPDGTGPLEESTEQLYEALFLDGYESQGEPDEVPIYLALLDPRNSKQSWVDRVMTDDVGPDLKPIVDPWRRAYFYRSGNDAMNPDFDLWSRGKDGRTNASDPDRDIDENRDDIRNF